MNKKSFSLFIIVVLFANGTYAQDTLLVRDLETWAGIELEKKLLNKKLEINLCEEFRFSNNSSELKEFFTEAGFTYEFYKNFKFGSGGV